MKIVTKIYAPLLVAMLWAVSVQAGQDKPKGGLNVCIDYHCDVKKTIRLNESHWQKILGPFAAPAANARQERKQISESIAIFEKVVGVHAGTSQDLAENKGSDEIGQLDCIAESINTTQYLNRLEKLGKLRWHSVAERKRRSAFIFDEHWSAVIKDKTTDTYYVVDSWFYENGAPPVIQELGEWLDKKPASSQLVP